MPQVFDPDEIFEMALELERNGAKFYKDAMAGVEDSASKELLGKLSEMEVKHEETFAKLKKDLTESDIDYYDPDGEAVKYLQSIASAQIFFKREIDVSSMEEILKEAILAEKDSTVFYLGMKEMVQDDSGKEKIEKIIKEEMGHIRILSEKLVEIKK